MISIRSRLRPPCRTIRHMRMRMLSALGFFVAAFVPAASTLAAPSSVTYAYDHHIFTVSVSQHPEWRQPAETWFFHGVPAVPPARFLSCGPDDVLEPGWTREQSVTWDEDAIKATLANDIASKLNRPAGAVTVTRSASGTILFDGQGLTGRAVDLPLTATLTKTALENDASTVVIPVTVTQPVIDVRDPDLVAQGIKEVVMVGESIFTKSPVNRRHNIAVGVSKFNGHLIPRGSVFSFDEVLGPVNDKTGYSKELVIQGDTTIPDYGGGLCQVSSTAYRGPWEYGLPILQRKNHSYAVSYYSPQGTDATIYPPNVDMKFRNDTPGALLMQTFVDDQDRAFFIYYGTKDDRHAEVFGPYITDRIEASKEQKTIYTTDIPPGQKRKAGERHDGMKAVWYRTVQKEGTGTVLERYFSSYEARPLTYQIGVTPEDMAKLTPGTASETPSWLPSNR